MLTPVELGKGCIGRLWNYQNQGHQGFLHYHDEVELNLVLGGTARYLVRGRRYSLEAGTLMWMPSKSAHLLSEKSVDLRMWIAVIRPGALSVAELGIEDSKTVRVPLCRRISLRQLAQISGLFREVAASPEPAELFNAGLVYAMLKAWEAHLRGEVTLGERQIHPGVQKAIQLMQRNGDSLPIPELARWAGLSASRFSEVFKRDTGMTPVEFRNRQRIERFMRLYGEGKKRTMLSAAFEAGFGSYPQFFRSFEEVMGYRPAEYRRQITAAVT